MTEHTHTDYVEGCHRCDLSREDARLAEEAEPKYVPRGQGVCGKHAAREIREVLARPVRRGAVLVLTPTKPTYCIPGCPAPAIFVLSWQEEVS